MERLVYLCQHRYLKMPKPNPTSIAASDLFWISNINRIVYIHQATGSHLYTSSYNPRPLNPHAPGTLTKCTLYKNAFNDMDSEILNSCENWASDYKIEVASLISWNPSLSTTNCSLQAGYSYCLDSSVPPEIFNCSRFPELLNITVADVMTSNPRIGSNCDTALWSKLSTDGYEQLRVHRKQ
ncbi:hypothetical protein TSTA_100360 [Talaromyces stipitatus ATCC 10500]|uniref:LysM domain-containing protein n=1 Tax=Talaromyces stipitatus (strain ATCC 10500 / CBS 375.48 / QM 6759 / NRRL 1006) TaxID=441959 RepID=B8MLS4_TALSN|nr:uncharacterized protein TSTA_100360 [Talaromyces stipitatus ATCC 10500]EED13791.1 hypothetical protein TSTA_100360 [Talaromyces stipitatus ATCC 10500]